MDDDVIEESYLHVTVELAFRGDLTEEQMDMVVLQMYQTLQRESVHVGFLNDDEDYASARRDLPGGGGTRKMIVRRRDPDGNQVGYPYIMDLTLPSERR